MEFHTSLLRISTITSAPILASPLSRIFYMQRLHPLAKFHGPWYAMSFSIVGAIISVKPKEPQFFLSLAKKYGRYFSRSTTNDVVNITLQANQSIRVSPTLLLFPCQSALKDIFWDLQYNQKTARYNRPAYVVSSYDLRK
jgi:hypothetical protein